MSAKILYSLLILGLISEKLELDFYCLCKVCSLKRENREKLSYFLEEAVKHRILLKGEKRRVDDLGIRVPIEEAPVVKREYDLTLARDRKAINSLRRRGKKPPPFDLGVVFEDRVAKIPENWVYMVQGRGRLRSGYRFALPRIEPLTIDLLQQTQTIPIPRSEWQIRHIESIFDELALVLKAYRYNEYLSKLEVIRSAAVAGERHQAVITGFALFDMLSAKTIPGNLKQLLSNNCP